MQLPATRSIVIISGLLTLLVLGGGTLAVAFHNGWLRTGSDTASRETVAASTQPRPAGDDQQTATPFTRSSPANASAVATQDEVGVYRQRLEEAYRALDDAYAQIRALQSPEPRMASVRDAEDRFTEHDGNGDRRERRSHRRDAHDD